jgi:hypothetical protein
MKRITAFVHLSQSNDFWNNNYNASVEFSTLEYFFVLKAHWAIRRVVIFYSAGVVTHDRKIGC